MRYFIICIYTRHLAILLGVTLLLCCKSEPTTITYKDNSESNYFEDYESPRFKWGLIDITGTEVLKAKYDDLKDPIDLNHIPASLKGKWSYINTQGKSLFPHQFKSVESWSDNAGWAQNFDDSYHIITDKSISDTINAEAVRPFGDGLAAIRVDGRWQYIDKQGQQAIPTTYNRAGQFADNQAIVKMPQGYAVIDKSGNYVIEPAYAKIKKDDSGYLVKNSDGYSYIDNSGKSKWKGKYEQATTFNGQFALVKSNGEYQIISQQGTVIKSLPYTYVTSAGEGYWKYRQEDKWGILNPNGKVIKEPTFIDCYQFEEGFLVAAIAEDKWGILDSELEVIVPFDYPLLWSFKNGYARIISEGFIQVINSEGEILPNIQQVELRDFHNGLARFQKYPSFQQ